MGFGIVWKEIGAIRLWGVWEIAVSGSFLFRLSLYCRLVFRTACVYVRLRYARFRGENVGLTRDFFWRANFGS